MANAKNIETVGKIKERLDRAKSVVLTDYRGLTHKQLEEIHKALKKINAEYLVVKNSLLRISLQSTIYNTLASSAGGQNTTLVGPTAVFINYGEEFTALKELFKFIKNFSLPKVKLGFINGVAYDDKQVTAIAAIPSKEVLYTKLVYTLNGNIQKLAYVLTQIGNSSEFLKIEDGFS